MRILITGATGFIASQIAATLFEAGHQIVCCVRNIAAARERFHYADIIECDFNTDTSAKIWLKRLRDNDIEVVINCVGILQGGHKQSITAIHKDAPIALFEACSQAQIRRVVQISALGAGEVDTDYSTTKNAADKYLLSLNNLSSLVIRPSVVYSTGSYGGTSLFRGLSALPLFIPVVGKGQQLMAPIFLADLARAILHYVEHHEISGKIIYAVGKEQITQKDMLLKLRRWLGLPKAICISIPLKLISFTAKCGNLLAKSPINSTTMKMLEHSNVADPEPFAKSVPFKIRGISEVLNSLPSSTQDRWHAKLYFLRPTLRLSLALLWIVSGIIPFINPIQSEFILTQLGIPENILTLTRVSFSILDISIGIGIITRWRINFLGLLQFFIVTAYTIAATFAITQQWLNPLGPILKNIPILVAILIWMSIEDDR